MTPIAVTAPNAVTSAQFGATVALSADGLTLVVGAPNEGSPSSGINGSLDASTALESGAVYVFHYTGSAWVLTAYVKPSNTASQAAAASGGGVPLHFGNAVAFSSDGTTLAIGATGDTSGAEGVVSLDAGPDAGENNVGQLGIGAVHVFR
jgi:hypothetical protein